MSSEKQEKCATALSYGSLLSLAVLQAIREVRAGVDPVSLAEFERGIQAGELVLAVHVQRHQGTGMLVLSAAALPKLDDPFEGCALLRIQGPAVQSLEELEALVLVRAADLN